MTTDHWDDPADLFYRGSSHGALTKFPLAFQLLHAERDRRQVRVKVLSKLGSIIASPVVHADEWLPVGQVNEWVVVARSELEQVEEEIDNMAVGMTWA